MTPALSYLICSTPRCGGGLLAGLLRSSGVAGRPEEYFWRDDMPSWRRRWRANTEREYVSAAVREGATDNGVFGARVMWGYLDDVIRLLTAATGTAGPSHEVLSSAFPDLRYVHLRREDRLAQAVSWAKALQTGGWYAGDPRQRDEVAVYDRSQIEALLGAVDEGERGWSSFFAEAGSPVHEITYEELGSEPLVSALRILRFLSLEPRRSLNVSSTRQADGTNAAWIDRFRAETSSGPGSGREGR